MAQPLRQIGLAPIGCTNRLRSQLARPGHDATCLSRARHRVAPGDGVVTGGPSQHKARVTVEDGQKLGRSIRDDPLGMVDRALHGVRQCCETGEDQGSGPARHEVGRRAARQGQGEGVIGIGVAQGKTRRDAPRVGRYCMPGLSQSYYRLSPGLQYLPTRAAQLERYAATCKEAI